MLTKQIAFIPKTIIRRKIKYGELFYDFFDTPFHLSDESSSRLADIMQRKYYDTSIIKGRVFPIGRVNGYWQKIPLSIMDSFIDDLMDVLCVESNWEVEPCPICGKPIMECACFPDFVERCNRLVLMQNIAILIPIVKDKEITKNTLLKRTRLRCRRCGYSWFHHSGTLPTTCANTKCRSPNWQTIKGKKYSRKR